MKDIIPSPNIWDSPAVYEIENRAIDPGGRLLAQVRQLHDWANQTVLDVGCGTGFHLPLFSETARHVIGVEPHPPLVAGARRRLASLRLTNVQVRPGTAQRLPVEDSAVDLVHARWAYFFGPGCEPGLAELDRVLRRGGTAFIIDNDASRSTFGRWFRRARPTYEPRVIENFFSSRGWQRQSVDMGWRFANRADFESVVQIEFTPQLAAQIVEEHEGTEVDYAVNLWSKTF